MHIDDNVIPGEPRRGTPSCASAAQSPPCRGSWPQYQDDRQADNQDDASQLNTRIKMTI